MLECLVGYMSVLGIEPQTDESTLQKVRLHKKPKHRQKLELDVSVTPQVMCVFVWGILLLIRPLYIS